MKSHSFVKVVLVGDTAVGKTAIFKYLEDNTFDPRGIPTVGGSYLALDLTAPDGSMVTIGLWDTAGQERFRTIVPMYFQRATAIVCVFDLTQRATFEHIPMWVQMAQTTAPPEVKFLLLGNKSDLLDDRKIQLSVATEFANSIRAPAYIETSALNGSGIDVLKNELGRLAWGVEQEKGPVDEINPEEATQSSHCFLSPGGKC
jgi:small GTP-binding protein